MSRKDNVQVFIRFRPENSLEKKKGTRRCMTFQDQNVVQSDFPPERPLRFRFDYVFPPESQQDEVYSQVGKPLIPEIFKGFNSTVFAYGQTGSGKTHSMMGVANDPILKGIIPRLVEDLFKTIQVADGHMEFTVKVSYVEIYMEMINDLLDLSKRNLKLRENKKREVYIDKVSEMYVACAEDVYAYMEEGTNNRTIACTKMNAVSSRSHSVFLMTLLAKNKEKGTKKSSKLILVDLAGSEKVGKTGASGQTLDEAKQINRSLTLLGKVISHLTKGSKHIPYRDSKLTRMLQDSLGGNSRTRLVVTASPSPYNYEETISTMRFGVRAKEIKNKAKVNQEMSASEYKRLYLKSKEKIKELNAIIKKYKKDLRAISKDNYVFPEVVRTRANSSGMREDPVMQKHFPEDFSEQTENAPTENVQSPKIEEETEDSQVEVIGGGLVGVNTIEFKKLQDELTAKTKAFDEQNQQQQNMIDQMNEILQQKEAEVSEQENLLRDKEEETQSLLTRLKAAEEKEKEFELFKIDAQKNEGIAKQKEKEFELSKKLLEQETKNIYTDLNKKCQEAVEYKIEIEESRAILGGNKKRLFGQKDVGFSMKQLKLQAENSALKERILFLTQISDSKDTQVKFLRDAADKSMSRFKEQTKKSNLEKEKLEQQLDKLKRFVSNFKDQAEHGNGNNFRRRASFSHHARKRADSKGNANVVIPIFGGGEGTSRYSLGASPSNLDDI